MDVDHTSLLSRGACERVVVCLSSSIASELVAELVTELGRNGYDVQLGQHLGATHEQVAADEAAIVVFDDSSPYWERSIGDLVHERPLVRPVLVARVDEPEVFLAAVAIGVAGFCRPDASLDALLRTIRSVGELGVAIPRDLMPPLVAEVRHGRGHVVWSAAGPIEVTDREWEILQLMMQRRSTREMAEELFVATGTIRSHVSTLVKKLGAVDRDDAIAMIGRGHR